MAAAVADFRPVAPAAAKIKKERGVPDLELEATPDTLAALGRARRPGQVLVGFAAETSDHVENARAKLERKHVDLVVANHVEGASSAFGGPGATAYLVAADGARALGDVPKATVAAALLDWVAERFEGDQEAGSG
jgi:phosphopantothenoylcysteine decarboxylase / phosphopantothenate---cysteine ligase